MHPDLWKICYVARCNASYYRRRASHFWYLDRGSQIASALLATAAFANLLGQMPPGIALYGNVLIGLAGLAGIASMAIDGRGKADRLEALAASWDALVGKCERMRLTGDEAAEHLVEVSEASALLHSEDRAPRWDWIMTNAQSEVDRFLGYVRASPVKHMPVHPPPPPPSRPEHAPPPPPPPPAAEPSQGK